MAIASFLERQTHSKLLDDTYNSDETIFNLYLNSIIDEKTYTELSEKLSEIKDKIWKDMQVFDKKQLK